MCLSFGFGSSVSLFDMLGILLLSFRFAIYMCDCEMEVIICVGLGVFLSVLGCELFCGDYGICVM